MTAVVSAALLALKEALGLQEPLWQADTEPCSETAPWPNLYCNSQGRVYMIDLSSKGLTGKLAEGVDLSNLPNLQALWLFDNPTLTGARVCSVVGGVRWLTSGAVLQAHICTCYWLGAAMRFAVSCACLHSSIGNCVTQWVVLARRLPAGSLGEPRAPSGVVPLQLLPHGAAAGRVGADEAPAAAVSAQQQALWPTADRVGQPACPQKLGACKQRVHRQCS